MKRLIAFLLAVAVSISCFPLSVLADPETMPAPDITTGAETPLTPVNHEEDGDIPEASSANTGTSETTEATKAEESTEIPTTTEPFTDTTENTDVSSQDSSTNAPDVPTEDALQYQEARSRLDSESATIEDAELLLTKKQFWPHTGTEDYDIFFHQILALFQAQLEAVQEMESLQELSYTLNLVETMLRMVPADVERAGFDSYLEHLHMFIDSMNVAAALEELAQMNVTPARYLSWTIAERQAYDNRQAEIRQMLEPVRDYLAAILPLDKPNHSPLELLEPVDVDSLLYTFQKNAGEPHLENSWQITASVKEADQKEKKLWLYPGVNPHSTELKDVLLNEDFSLGTAEESSLLLCFNGYGFQTTTSIFDCTSLVLFRNEADPNGKPSYLDGMTQLHVGQMPKEDNDRLFIGLIVPIQDGAAVPHGKLYLMDPTSGSGFVLVKENVALQTDNAELPVEADSPIPGNIVMGNPASGQHIIEILIGEAKAGQQIEETHLIFSSLNATEETTPSGITYKTFTKDITAEPSSLTITEEVEEAPAEEDEPTPTSDGAAVLATAKFRSMDVMRYNVGYRTTNENVPLARCAFQFIPRSLPGEKKYFIRGTATDGIQYLKVNGNANDSGYVLTNDHSKCAPIHISNESGYFQFYTMQNGIKSYLYFIPAWNVFTNEAYKNEKNPNAVLDNNFILYRQCDEAFYQITSLSEVADYGSYLIIPANGKSGDAKNLLLYPAATAEYSSGKDTDRNSVVVGIDSALNQYSSTVGFDVVGHNTGTGYLFGQHYALTLVSQYDPTHLPEMQGHAASAEPLKTAVIVGGSVDVLDERISLKDNSEIIEDTESAKNGTVSWEILETLEKDTFAQLGTNEDYNGDTISLKECLYTFTGSNGQYKISHEFSNGTRVYLDLSSHGYPNRVLSENAAPTFTVSANGSGSGVAFAEIKQNDTIGHLYFWGWGIFTASNSSQLSNTRDGLGKILLYRPSTAGEDSSTELPGYVRVAPGNIQNGGQYLMAVVYLHKGQYEMYFIHPSTSMSSRNAHVARRTTQWTDGSTRIRFTGISVESQSGLGQIKLKTDTAPSYSYQIDIMDPQFIANLPLADQKLVIGTGTGIGGFVNSLYISTGTSFRLKPAEGYDDLLWLSENNALVSVDQNGMLTIHDPEDMKNQERKEVNIFVLLKQGDQQIFYNFPVTVLKNEYENTRLWNYYIEDIVNTDVFMSFPEDGVTAYDEHNFMPVEHYQVNYLLRDVDKPWGTHFFARPKPGYALYFMDAPGSNGDYKKLDSLESTQTEYYRTGPCGSQAGLYGQNVITSMLKKAIDEECVGAMGFTGYAGDYSTKAVSLAFRSAKLATLDKSVEYILNSDDFDKFKNTISGQCDIAPGSTALSEFESARYTPGKHVSPDDYIIYTITVDTTHSDNNVQYTKIELTDELDGVEFFTSGSKSLLVDETQLSNVRSYYYAYLKYNNDEPINTVTMACSFTSDYQGEKTVTQSIDAHAALTKSIQSAVQYTSLTLEQTLFANIYIQELFTDWNNDSHYVVFDFGPDGNPPRPTKIKVTSGEAASITGTPYRRYSVPIPAQFLTQEIKIYVENADGVKVSDEWSFSAMNYIKETITDLGSSSSKLITEWTVNGKESFFYSATRGAALKQLLLDLVNYSAYTQLMLDPNVSTYTTRKSVLLAELQGQLADPLPSVDFSQINFTATNWYQLSGNDPMISFTGVSLETGGQNLGMRVYFRSSQGLNLSKTQGTVQHISTEPGNILYLENAETVIHQDPAKPFTYFVSIRNIPVNQLSCIYRVQIQRTEDYGTQRSCSVSLNALAYVYLMKKSNADFDESLKNLAAAIYNYNQSALAYFQPAAAAKFAIG